MIKTTQGYQKQMRGLHARLFWCGVLLAPSACSGEDDGMVGESLGSEDTGTTGWNSTNSSDSGTLVSTSDDTAETTNGPVAVETTGDDSSTGDATLDTDTGSDGISSEGGESSTSSGAELDGDTITDDIASVISELRAHNDRTNLVVTVESTDIAWRLAFEGGEEVLVPAGLVREVVDSPDEWRIEIEFVDGDSVSIGRLGTDLPFNESNVELNPFGRAPLAARLVTTSPVPGRFQVRVVGVDGPQSDFIGNPSSVDVEHELAILGLYGGDRNEVVVSFLREDGAVRISKTIFVETLPLPAETPSFRIDVPYTTAMPGPNTVFAVNYRPTHDPVMADVFGKVRYLLLTDNTQKRGLQKFANGNIGFGNSNGFVQEYSWMGELVGEWSVGPGFRNIHHDVYELPSGNFLVTVSEAGADTVQDVILELDRETGEIVTLWDMKDSLQQDRLRAGEPDWFHNNAVIYDPSDDTIIVSGAYQGVIKLTWDNQLVWILEHRTGWNDQMRPYLLEVTGGVVPSGSQHSPHLMPNGNVLVYDNGGLTVPGTEMPSSRIAEYAIVPYPGGGGTVEEVFEYGTNRADLYSSIVSDVDYYDDNDHRVMVSGAISRVYDDALGEWGWDLEQLEKARIVEVDAEGNVHFEMAVLSSIPQSGSVYRAERLVVDM